MIPFAHRGGAYHPEIEGLENTIAAFRHAVALGYRHLETDVHLTRDGVLLAFHDEVLDRVTDRVGAVKDLTLADIREARIGGREQVPTFQELLDAFPTTFFNVDLKAEGAVDALAELIAEQNLWDRICVGSFSIKRIRRFRALTHGRIPTAAHPLEILAYRLLPSAGLAGLVADRVGGDFTAFQVPHRQGRVRVVTPGLVRRAHANGKQVHVWTIDDPAEMHELIDRGVDGLFTDRTDLLKEVLVARGLWQ